MSKIVIMEFVGGFRDGLIWRSDDQNPEFELELSAWWFATEQGTIGRGMRGVSDAALANLTNPNHVPTRADHQLGHKYVIVSREETDETIHVKLKYSVLPEYKSDNKPRE